MMAMLLEVLCSLSQAIGPAAEWPELRPPPVIEGSTLELRYVRPGVGEEDGEAFSIYPLRDLFVVAPRMRRNVDPIAPADARRGTLRLALDVPGTHRVGAETAPWVERVDAAQLRRVQGDRRFNRLESVAVEGDEGEAELALPTGEVLVRRILTVSCVFEVGEGGGGIATRKTGLPIEVRLLSDPRGLAGSDDQPVRLYVDGEAQTGARVHALHESGRTTQAWSDAEGIACLRLDRGGRWCLRYQHLRIGSTDQGAWDWLQSTMVFHAPDRFLPTDDGSSRGTANDQARRSGSEEQSDSGRDTEGSR